MSIDRIQGVGVAAESSSPQAVSPATQQAPERADVQWFSAAIQPSTQGAGDNNVAERIVGQLSGSSEHLQRLSDQADRALRKASSSSDPMDVVQANRSLSSFYLESLLTTKLISKGTQAVEKLTNLQ